MASVVATGDFMPQRPFRETASAALALLANADVSFVNLEGPLTDTGTPADTIAWVRGERALAEELAAAGVTVASLANNHAADLGVEGLLDTLEALRAAGVQPVGAGVDLERAFVPAIATTDGIDIGLVALATTLPNGCAAAERRPGIAPVHVLSRFVVDPVVVEQNPGMAPYVETTADAKDVEVACAAVAAAKAATDVVVVGIHWGVPDGWAPRFQAELADYQRPLAHALVDAGADAVIGHHPHVLHGIEIYKQRPIFYSLGNFLFHSLVSGDLVATRRYPPYDFSSLRVRHGGVARLSWTTPGPPEAMELAIVCLDSSGDPHRLAVADGDAAIGRVDELSARFAVSVGPPQDGPWRPIVTTTTANR